MVEQIYIEFIHEFMEREGVPVQRTEAECIEFLENHGCSKTEVMGVIKKACAENWIFESSSKHCDVKTYN